MKTINKIAVFDNDKYVLAMLKGYCYANNITMTEADFNRDGINEIEKQNPDLIVVPLDWISTVNTTIESYLLRRMGASGEVKICGLSKNTTDAVSKELSDWVDIIINSPFDIGEIDRYLKKTFLFSSCLTEKRLHKDRRSFSDRRNVEPNRNGGDGYKTLRSPDHQYAAGSPELKGFLIDQRKKCVFLKGHKVDLTRKEFELIELLSKDGDHIFTADEIINHLWPESNRATKSDLYQYMHLLRKKIEEDPNNPEWIMTVKGFGYRLNTGNSEEMYQRSSGFPEIANKSNTFANIQSGSM